MSMLVNKMRLGHGIKYCPQGPMLLVQSQIDQIMATKTLPDIVQTWNKEL